MRTIWDGEILDPGKRVVIDNLVLENLAPHMARARGSQPGFQPMSFVIIAIEPVSAEYHIIAKEFQGE